MVEKIRAIPALSLAAFSGGTALMATVSVLLAIFMDGPRREPWCWSTGFFVTLGIAGWWVANRLWPDRRFLG